MTSPDPTFTRWHKSSYSGAQSDCAEVGFTCAPAGERAAGVRDSKNLGGPMLVFNETAWNSFITATKKRRRPNVG